MSTATSSADQTPNERRAVITGQHGWFGPPPPAARLCGCSGSTHDRTQPATYDVDGALVPLVALNMSDGAAVKGPMRAQRPGEIYNFGARVDQVFDEPLATTDINGVALA